MTDSFRLYPDGNVFFCDDRVTEPISFAHVVDLHLPPRRDEAWPAKYRHAIQWWNIECGRSHQRLPGLLDAIKDAEVDFVFFGGDVLDYYDPETADYVVALCRERDLTCHFQIGNHDYETDNIRYLTHEIDFEVRDRQGGKLCDHWSMPGLYYAFDHHGARFISLDTPYMKYSSGETGGEFDQRQVDWLVEQLKFDGPIIVFQHVPFNLPTVEHRMRAIWNGALACVTEDDQGRRVKSAIQTCANLLGTFNGHTHMRSEDPIGTNYQFITGPGHSGHWRHVRIESGSPPKSMIVEGEPSVR